MSEAPAVTTPPSTPPATPPATPPSEPQAFDWKTTGLAADDMVLVNERQWKSPADLVNSYRNLEKLKGVPADRLLTVPQDDTPESWNPIWDKLGRPKEAKDYGLPVPEGDKGEFAATAASWFHEAGLTGKQARAVAAKWNEYVAGAQKQQTEATQARDADQLKQLRTEWGPQFDAAMGLVDKAASTFGIPAEGVAALKNALGPAVTAKILHGIGSKLGVEGDFISGDGASRGAGDFSAMTPEQAQAKIRENQNDRAFTTRFVQGEREAREEMRKLHRIAYPGDTVL